jgi:toxin secretion/phage lysis holin
MEKISIFGSLGMIVAFIAEAFGGWSQSMTTLVIFMVIDYITGMIVAGLFKKSTKTKDGGLESLAGWKGLARKFSTLLLVLIAVRVDIALNTNYICNTVVYAFMANEALSIIENVGLMGVPLPAILTNAITLLNKKGEQDEL